MFHASDQPDTIDPRLLNRGFTKEQLDALRQGAEQRVESNEIVSLNTRITGDLGRFNYNLFDYVINLYHVYNKAGTLPYPGSTSEQPAKIIEIFNTIEQLYLEQRQQEIAKQEKESKRNG